MKTKVRVDRSKLIEVVRGRLRKEENEYKRAAAAFPKKLSDWNVQQADRLDKLAAKARNGGLRGDESWSARYEKPTKPSEGKELCNLRRMLKTLEIGSEDTILLSQEDADWYFGPCRL